MPIDPRIALGYQAPQFESPVNMMMMAQKLQSGQQENQLRQAQMENYQAEAARRTALLPYEQKKMADESAAAGLTRDKSQVELLDSKLKQSRSFLDTIDPNDPNAPSAFLAWHQANHNDPIIGPALQARGVTVDSARAQIDAALAQPGGFARLLEQSKLGAEKFAENTRLEAVNAETKFHNRRTETLTERGQNLTAATAQRGQNITAANKTVEKPLTALQQQNLRKAKAEDADKYSSANSTANELETIADKLLGNPGKKIKPHPGLGGITGLAGALPDMYGGDAKAARQQLETFKGKVKSLGRQLASVHGKLGNMAVQEWKMVSDAVEAIDPSAPNFDEQLRDVVRQARELSDRTQSRYEATYDEKLPGQQKAEARAMSGEDRQALDWANANPNDKRAAAIKQRLGM
jgi:hypothetical protein